MRKFIILLVILAAGFGLYYLSNGGKPAGLARYQDENLPLSFAYNEADYVVLEQEPNESNPDLIKTIVLIDQRDYESLINGEREGGEGPPAIVLQIYQNPLKLEPQAWAEQNANISNIPLILGTIEEDMVDSRPGIAYTADGLYQNRNIVFAGQNRIYYISGSYLDRESPIYRDFGKLIESLEIEK